MRLVKNISVKVKLLTAFISVSALLVVIGIVAGLGFQNMERSSSLLYEDNLLNIDYLHQIKENIAETTMLVTNVVLEEDIEGADTAQQELETLYNEYQTLMDAFSVSTFATIFGSDITGFTDLQNAYGTALQTVLEQASAGDFEAAYTALQSAKDVEDQLDESLNGLITQNQNLAQSSYTNNETEAQSTMKRVIAIIIAGFVWAVAAGLLLSIYISKYLRSGLAFAQALGNGDFSKEWKVSSKDEFGKLSVSLNQAQEKIRSVIREVTENANNVSESSQQLSATLEEITSSFETINGSTEKISENIESINAITQELNATAMQVDSGIGELAENASRSSNEATDIKQRASAAMKRGVTSKDIADRLYEEKESKIKHAIEKAAVVNEINVIAKSIADIAEQTNLLALNAAIEAARAGDQGRGFAVVAEQVRILAEQSTSYVGNIQKVVKEVQSSVDNLAVNTADILKFIGTQVKGDYELLIQTGTQYEKDATFVSDISSDNAAMAQELSASTDEISNVVSDISHNMQSTAENSVEISASIREAERAVEQAAVSAQAQADASEKLYRLISNFTL